MQKFKKYVGIVYMVLFNFFPCPVLCVTVMICKYEEISLHIKSYNSYTNE